VAAPRFAGLRSSRSASLDDVLDVLRAGRTFDLSDGTGADHGLLDHSLQTAELLRSSHPDDLALQVAGLVHDIGHMLPPHRDDAHADVAAVFVRPVFGDRIAELVRLHVPAKRYLVTTDPDYRAGLHRGSVISLGQQGGDMSCPEITAFEAEPLFGDATALRRADEAGKVPGLDVPGLETWLATLQSQQLR